MAQEIVYERSAEDAKQFARIMYIAHGLTWFFSLGTLSVLVLIVNYIKRPDTHGTIVYSHHTWMIRSFWFYLLWMIVGGILLLVLVGYAVWGLAWLWLGYRIARGFIDLNSNKPMPV
jgi:uncharacterized membrane protein